MSDTSEVAAPLSMEAQMLATLEVEHPSAIPSSKADEGSTTKTETTEEGEEGTESDESTADDAAGDEQKEEGEAADKPDGDTKAAPVDPDFAEAMRKRGITVDLSDVPKELRPVLLDKVKAMDAGYTKVRQDAATFRAEKAAFEAEKTYRESKKEQYIADLIEQDPSLIDAINDEVERRKDPTYGKALAKERETATREAAIAAKEAELAERTTAEREAEADRLDAYVTTAIAAAKIPTELVSEAITLFSEKILHDEDRFPTAAEFDALIDRHAKVYRKHVGVAKGVKARETTRQYLDGKRQDKADAQHTSTPSGTATATGGLPAKKPANLEEAMYAKLDALGLVA